MPLRVRISARAAAQVRENAQWWRNNRPSAPGAVSIDFREAIAVIAEQPGVGALYEGARTSGVRRHYLSRVRYFVQCRFPDESLDILAFWHVGRGRQPTV